MHRRLSFVFVIFSAGTLFLAGFFLFGQNFRQLSLPSPVPYFRSKPHTSIVADKAIETTVTKGTFADTVSSSDPVSDANTQLIAYVNTARTSLSVGDANTQSFAYVNTARTSQSVGKAATSTYTHVAPSSVPQSITTKKSPAKTTAGTKETDISSDEEKVDSSSQRLLNVAITESMGAHDEVVAALVHSFGSQKNAQISGLFLGQVRWGMPEIMDNFTLAHAPLPKNKGISGFNDAAESSNSSSTSPDILVISTCELDMIKFRSRLDILLKRRKTYIFCVIHHADRWHTDELKDAVTPWLQAGLFDFVALSAHTANYLKTKGLKDWKINITSPVVYPPVFPVSLPPVVTEQEKAFALQGNYEASRRDFNTIFTHLQSFINASSSANDEEQANVTLRLLGSGKRPTVPGPLSEHVFFDEGLSYKDYYSVLSHTFALLPAFANDEYLQFKASSTIPASLLSGTPLVATKEILEAYSYLPEDAVYFQKDQETELEVIGKVLKANAKELEAKKSLVREACAKILDDNVDLIGTWLKKAALKTGH